MAITINTSLRISAVDCYEKINEEGEGGKKKANNFACILVSQEQDPTWKLDTSKSISWGDKLLLCTECFTQKFS